MLNDFRRVYRIACDLSSGVAPEANLVAYLYAEIVMCGYVPVLEYPFRSGDARARRRADIAVFRHGDNKPRLLIEVKASKRIEMEDSQRCGYEMSGVEFVLVRSIEDCAAVIAKFRTAKEPTEPTLIVGKDKRCPKCRSTLKRRTNKMNGRSFWGCSSWKGSGTCSYTEPVDK